MRLHLVAAVIFAVVLTIALADRLGRRLNKWIAQRRYLQLASTVEVGDLWELRAGHRWKRPLQFVVAPNRGTEAGPDSWEMTGGLYMHSPARNRGEWVLRMRDGKPVSDPAAPPPPATRLDEDEYP